MDCEFCTVKGVPRAACPERLLEQIALLVETRDARHFFIVDDLFGQHRKETLEFCRMLKRYQERIGKRLDFTVQIRLDKARDHELLSLMRQARLDTIQILLPVPLPGTQLRERLERQNRIYDIDAIVWEYYDGNFPVFEPDPPLTPKTMQAAQRQIAASFYRFSFFFRIGLDILAFPTLVFFFYNMRFGWRQWYRSWRNHLVRFMGWMIMREWGLIFKKDKFQQKLQVTLERRVIPGNYLKGNGQ